MTKGFTLMESLVVVLIIGLLASFAVVRVQQTHIAGYQRTLHAWMESLDTTRVKLTEHDIFLTTTDADGKLQSAKAYDPQSPAVIAFREGSFHTPAANAATSTMTDWFAYYTMGFLGAQYAIMPDFFSVAHRLLARTQELAPGTPLKVQAGTVNSQTLLLTYTPETGWVLSN